jgi:hypothetical protein
MRALLGIAAALAVAVSAAAQTPPAPPPAAPPAAAPPAATPPAATPPQRGPVSSALNYVPGVGDLMQLLVQPRHAKLGLAFQEKNWALAGYAFKELQQALATVGKVQPKWRNLTVAEMIESMTGDSMRDLDEAIQAKNAKQFALAYEELTAGCNSCHTALNHGFIVIKTPDASAFPNQEFKVP